MRSNVYFLLALAFMGANALFDCGRDTTLCKNEGTCNFATGNCDCHASGTGATYEGKDCSIISDDKDDEGVCAEDTCKNDGICYKTTGDVFACSCSEMWDGATCESKRYGLRCGTDGEMSMTIRPHVNTFSGKIYVKEKLGKCDFTPATQLEFEKMNVVKTNVDCGPITETDQGEYVRVVYVQFLDNLLTQRDEVVTFSCSSAGETLTLTKPTITVAAADSNLKPVTKAVGGRPGDVEMTIRKVGTEVTGSVTIGDKLDITIALTNEGKDRNFKAVRITSCVVTGDTVLVATLPTQMLIESSCPADLQKNLLVLVGSSVMTEDDSGTARSFSFRAFRFTAGTGVAILSCDVKLCETKADCDPIDCNEDNGGGSGGGLGRKKRESAVEEKTLTQSFQIRDPASIVDALKEIQEQKACYQTWEMTATVVALAVGLLLLLILCIVLMVKVILNRKSASSYRDDTSETTSTAKLPYLPHLVSNK